MKEVMAAAMTMMKEERDKEKQGSKGEGKGDRVKLEEKYFRRMDLFEGDRSKFRNWIFDLTVAVGLVDRHLSEALTNMMSQVRDEHWDPGLELIPRDTEKSRSMHDKYAGELYGVLCSITGGEAKNLVRGIRDDQGQTKMDGFRALL